MFGEGGGMQIECQTCGWVGENKDLVAVRSDLEPGCPECGSTDFLDVEEAPKYNEDDPREER